MDGKEAKKEAWKKMVDMYSRNISSTEPRAEVLSGQVFCNPEKKVASLNHVLKKQEPAKKTETASERDPDPRKQKGPEPEVSVKIKLAMKSTGMVEIKPSNKAISVFLSKYDQNLAKYQVKTNSWIFSQCIYDTLVKKMKDLSFLYESIPRGTLSVARRKLPGNEFRLEGGIYSQLLPFQKESVLFALNRNGRIILADDMGLGKTIQALAIANYYKLEWPLLIIAPASLLDNWNNSVRIFLDTECSVAKKKSDFHGKVCVTSYDIAAKNSETLRSVDYAVVIADECHYLKSSNTKRTSKLLPHLQRASRLILISGTPALSRPLELYPLISAIDKNLYPNFMEYGRRYCNGRKVNHWYDYKGCSNAEELFFVLNKALMVRRTKDEVMSELPPKTRRHVILSAKPQSKVLDVEDVEKPSSEVMKRYVEAAELKVDAVTEYISNMLEKSTKFLVYAHHTTMMDGVEKFLVGRHVRFIKIDGCTPSSQRQALCDSFQNNEDVRVALLSLTAASTGLTLTAGKAVIFAELYWNPGTLLQAEDRIHRIGQKCCVDIHYLLAKDTIDEYVWPKLLKKLSVLESLGIGTNDLKNVKEAQDPKTKLDFYMHKSK